MGVGRRGGGGGGGGGRGGRRLRIGFKVKTLIVGCLMCDTCSMNLVTSVTCASQAICITRS